MWKDHNIKTRVLWSLVSAFLGTALAICVFLPWFNLPILGWSLPSPAWNKAGMGCLIVASFLYLRAIGGYPIRWLVRVAVPPALYFWWFSLEEMRSWGTQNLAPAQLKLSTVNGTLSKLGGTPVTIYEPALWRSLEPSWGWKAAGVCLALTALFAVLDGPRIPKCGSCGASGRDGESFCHECGEGFGPIHGCKNCGHKPGKGDSYCGRCSFKLS